jgi:hypothetical protein
MAPSAVREILISSVRIGGKGGNGTNFHHGDTESMRQNGETIGETH